MINRAAVILEYKKPAVDWINDSDPYDGSKLSIDDVNDEHTVYLVEAEFSEAVDRFLKKNFMEIFQNELFQWYEDESLWPKKLTYDLFNEWFDVKCHSIIEDLGKTKIVNEDY